MIRLAFLFLFFSQLASTALTSEILERKKGAFTVGIMSAVAGESSRILEGMQRAEIIEKGMRTFYVGELYGINTVLVNSRVGKVAAAATAAHLIVEYNVDLIIFTGVAGALDPELHVGDIVIAHALLQHDVDSRPFCPLYEIPLLKIKACEADPILEQIATQACQQCVEQDLKQVPASLLAEFNIVTPKVMTGLVLTGDKVIAEESQKSRLKAQLPSALCVEMEGASVAQVCYEYGVPCLVVRTISDYASHEHIPIDIKKFVNQISGFYSEAIIKNMYALMIQ